MHMGGASGGGGIAQSSHKDDAQADLNAIFEQVMMRVKSLPRMTLTEPEVRINFNGLSDGKLPLS